MQLYPLKLVTVVGETVIMDDIAQDGVRLGATGYTLSEVAGQGSRGARAEIITGAAKTMKCEFVVPMDVAEKILRHVSHDYFEHYACIAWLSDVQVVRGQAYVKS
jgi:nitrogen regulatory protein P-II 2